MRSSVSIVMRLPSRNRCTSLPSLTTRRPNVVSAMSDWRQKSVIWLRIWSFFIGQGFGKCRWAVPGDQYVLPPSAHRVYVSKTGTVSLEPTALPNIQGDKVILWGEDA